MKDYSDWAENSCQLNIAYISLWRTLVVSKCTTTSDQRPTDKEQSKHKGLFSLLFLLLSVELFLIHPDSDHHPPLQVSKAAADLMAYCDAHSCDDPLISPVPTSENPFREKKFFCALLWDQSGIVVIQKVQLYSMYMYVKCVHVLPI